MHVHTNDVVISQSNSIANNKKPPSHNMRPGMVSSNYGFLLFAILTPKKKGVGQSTLSLVAGQRSKFK